MTEAVLERILAIAGSVAGILGLTAVPITIAWINSRKPKEDSPPEPAPTFGLTVDPDAERIDRLHEALVAAHVERAERAEARERETAARASERERELLAEIDSLREEVRSFRADHPRKDPA